jgi:hypothetical protein
MKTKGAIIMIILIAAAVFFGCKKSEPQDQSGIITMKIGSVRIQREGGQIVEALVKYTVHPGDTILTDKNSAAVVQFADNFVLRVDEATVLRVKSATANDREVFVKDGQVLAKLVKTGANTATISTPTSVAAVRGTQFSVNYREGKTLVAVTEGKVAVKAVRAEEAGTPASGQSAEETIAEAGKTAEVAAAPGDGGAPLALKMRDISDTEKKELRKIESIPVIPEVEKKETAAIESTVSEAINQAAEKEKKEDVGAAKEDKKKAVLEKKTRSMEEIREAFSRIDEITLYNGRVIRGAVISRGAFFTIVTPGGTITVPEKQIKGSRILR